VEEYEEWQLRKVIKRVDLKPPKRVNKHFHTCQRCGFPFVTTKHGRICDSCVKPRGFLTHKKVMLRNHKV
jgi:rubrerythrin